MAKRPQTITVPEGAVVVLSYDQPKEFDGTSWRDVAALGERVKDVERRIDTLEKARERGSAVRLAVSLAAISLLGSACSVVLSFYLNRHP